jgi:hypothetical protein
MTLSSTSMSCSQSTGHTPDRLPGIAHQPLPCRPLPREPLGHRRIRRDACPTRRRTSSPDRRQRSVTSPAASSVQPTDLNHQSAERAITASRRENRAEGRKAPGGRDRSLRSSCAASVGRVIGIPARPLTRPCGWGYRCPFQCRARVPGRTRSLPAPHAGGASPADDILVRGSGQPGGAERETLPRGATILA